MRAVHPRFAGTFVNIPLQGDWATPPEASPGLSEGLLDRECRKLAVQHRGRVQVTFDAADTVRVVKTYDGPTPSSQVQVLYDGAVTFHPVGPGDRRAAKEADEAFLRVLVQQGLPVRNTVTGDLQGHDRDKFLVSVVEYTPLPG